MTGAIGIDLAKEENLVKLLKNVYLQGKLDDETVFSLQTRTW